DLVRGLVQPSHDRKRQVLDILEEPAVSLPEIPGTVVLRLREPGLVPLGVNESQGTLLEHRDHGLDLLGQLVPVQSFPLCGQHAEDRVDRDLHLVGAGLPVLWQEAAYQPLRLCEGLVGRGAHGEPPTGLRRYGAEYGGPPTTGSGTPEPL